jgi:putative lipoprotein
MVGTAHAVRADDDAWLGRDKALHFAISAAISGSAYGLSALVLEHPGYRCLVGASVGLSAGIAKEIWDASGHGDPSFKDLTWDVVGVVTGTTLALGVDLIWRRTRRRSATASWPMIVRF